MTSETPALLFFLKKNLMTNINIKQIVKKWHLNLNQVNQPFSSNLQSKLLGHM